MSNSQMVRSSNRTKTSQFEEKNMTLKAIGATLITLLVTSIAQAQTPVTVFFTPATPHSAFITKASKDYDAVYTKLASILKDKQKKDYLLVNSSEKATITFTVVSIEQADGNAVTSRTAECLLLRCADTETRTERGLQVHATLTVKPRPENLWVTDWAQR